MNLANKITMFRVVLIPVFVVVLMAGYPNETIARYAALIIFIVASLTDFLDGYIARSRNLVTNFGKFADPLADKLLVSAALVCMVELKNLAAWVVIIIISREFIISGFRQVASLSGKVIAASKTAKFKTATQMVMIILVLLPLGGIIKILADVAVVLSVILTVVSAVEYIVKNADVLKD